MCVVVTIVADTHLFTGQTFIYGGERRLVGWLTQLITRFQNFGVLSNVSIQRKH